MLSALIALNEETAQRKSIRIEADMPRSLLVEADEDHLIEAVDNLISNAIKFSPSGSNILVCAHEMRGATTIEVADQGIGLSREELSSIFDRYQVGSSPDADTEASFGLGLWIVKTIAERHGGKAQATSEGVGKGSTFSISIPSRNVILGSRHSD